MAEALRSTYRTPLAILSLVTVRGGANLPCADDMKSSTSSTAHRTGDAAAIAICVS